MKMLLLLGTLFLSTVSISAPIPKNIRLKMDSYLVLKMHGLYPNDFIKVDSIQFNEGQNKYLGTITFTVSGLEYIPDCFGFNFYFSKDGLPLSSNSTSSWACDEATPFPTSIPYPSPEPFPTSRPYPTAEPYPTSKPFPSARPFPSATP